MSIYDKASLVQIPSGVKSGTLYNVVPNTADGDFDFTRGSSATRVNKDGLIETVASGVPRLDYPLLDGVVQDCPALLLEPSRQNLITYSEDFSNAAWTLAGVTVTSNDTTSPDGSINADRITATNIDPYIYTIPTVSTGDNTFSLYYKGEASSIGKEARVLFWYVGSATGTTTSHSFTLTGEWQRFEATTTTTGSGTLLVRIDFPADTAVVNDYAYIWGAQLEAGSYATSYIPTSGSAVTRSADACNGAQATFNDSEGVLFADIAALANDGTNRVISISDGSLNNRVFIKYSSTNNQIEGTIVSGNIAQAAMTETLTDALLFSKICVKYKVNDFSLWVNGFEVNTDTSGSAPTGLSDISFDTSGLNDFYGNTKQLMTFNEALSDTELENLTSWDSFKQMATEQLYSIE